MDYEYQKYTQSRIKFRRFFLKTERLSESLIFQSSLFHLDKAEGKNKVLKNNRVLHELLEYYC